MNWLFGFPANSTYLWKRFFLSIQKKIPGKQFSKTLKHETWIPRGYIVVHSSSPGTGLSDGSPTVGGDNESLALAAATTGVDGLEAIIPIAPGTSYYHYYRSNGLVRSPKGYLGEDADVLYDFIHSGPESKRAYSNAEIRDKEMAQGMELN